MNDTIQKSRTGSKAAKVGIILAACLAGGTLMYFARKADDGARQRRNAERTAEYERMEREFVLQSAERAATAERNARDVWGKERDWRVGYATQWRDHCIKRIAELHNDVATLPPGEEREDSIRNLADHQKMLELAKEEIVYLEDEFRQHVEAAVKAAKER